MIFQEQVWHVFLFLNRIIIFLFFISWFMKSRNYLFLQAMMAPTCCPRPSATTPCWISGATFPPWPHRDLVCFGDFFLHLSQTFSPSITVIERMKEQGLLSDVPPYPSKRPETTVGGWKRNTCIAQKRGIFFWTKNGSGMYLVLVHLQTNCYFKLLTFYKWLRY